MDERSRNRASELMAEITALLEDAHEQATAGQAEGLSLEELYRLVGQVESAAEAVKSRADEVAKLCARRD